MLLEFLIGLFLPFLGTVLGAALVFFMRGGLSRRAEEALLGLSGGVMVAASIFSLLLPAIERASYLGTLAFLPAVSGVMAGFFFLLLFDCIFPYHEAGEGGNAGLRMLVLSVTLHNIPEGMAVGVLLSARLAGDGAVSAAAAITLAIGIAIQNFPEGAIISLPLCGGGGGRWRSFFLAVLSALAELFGALLALLMASLVGALLPFFLSFAAGAMLFVVVDELVPDAAHAGKAHTGTVFFALGFSLMTALDVALG